MLGWIPIIGPIIDGIVSIFGRYFDTNLQLIKSKAEVDIAAMEVGARIIRDTKDDIGIRICRDLMIFPVCVWTALITWDTIMAKHAPEWMFIVEKFPDSVSYLPMAVIIFLLGQAAFFRFGKI